MKSLIYLIFICLALSSCLDDNSISINQTSNATPNEYGDMHLYHLSVGDEFYFGKFVYKGQSQNESIPFTGDTMILRVNNIQNDTIVWDAEFNVRDGLTEMVGGIEIPVRDTTIELKWCINSKQLINISETEGLDHPVAEDPLYTEYSLPMNYSAATKYEMDQWRVNLVYHEQDRPQNTSGFMLGGTDYRYLKDTMNTQVSINSAPTTPHIFYHTVYSLDNGLVNTHITFSPMIFNNYPRGWIRLKKPM